MLNRLFQNLVLSHKTAKIDAKAPIKTIWGLWLFCFIKLVEVNECRHLQLLQIEVILNLFHRINVPSLHVYGLEDKVIGGMSSDLVPYFDNPTVVEHPGGHFIPATSKQKEPYMNFIRSFARNETLQ